MVNINGCASPEIVANPSKVCNSMDTTCICKFKISEILEWFNHLRVDSLVNLPLPLNIRNDSQWMGVAFCCIL
ncbi:TMV resistance protein N-like isoform X4 [Gossypium australe]|uniref:TMV resistance protein N-like isoform X4 n=1 Tax=Gossypium australe TaxID=47621 RepID=A0A5B6VTI2_9ROSI|nr:TMV resistance protein N-like isoform X4 [Gossypium australe]